MAKCVTSSHEMTINTPAASAAQAHPDIDEQFIDAFLNGGESGSGAGDVARLLRDMESAEKMVAQLEYRTDVLNDKLDAMLRGLENSQ